MRFSSAYSLMGLPAMGRGEYEITEAYQNMVDHKLNIGYSVISG